MSSDARRRMARSRWSRRASNAAVVFAALGDTTRLALVGKLGDRAQRSITELGRDSALSRQAITRHLRVLEDAGVVRSRRQGRESLFTLDPKAIIGLQEYLRSEEHTSELKSLMRSSYAVFCLKQKIT